MNNDRELIAFYMIFALGIVLGSFLVYMANVKGSIAIEEKIWKCIDADFVGEGISPAQCSLFIRKNSEIYKQYQKLSGDQSV